MFQNYVRGDDIIHICAPDNYKTGVIFPPVGDYTVREFLEMYKDLFRENRRLEEKLRQTTTSYENLRKMYWNEVSHKVADEL